MNSCCLFGPSLASLFWVIVKGATGPKAIASHLFFGLIVSASWLVCQPSTVGALNKEIAKTLSARAFFLLRKPLSLNPLQGIRMLTTMNIGFSSKLFMAFVGAPATGTRNLTPFFAHLVSSPACTILACTLVSYAIQTIPPGLPHLSLCQWG